jgi:Tfp pilus assembly protein PilN
MKVPLNLARRPFRNERLPTLAFGIGIVVLVALSLRHAFVARELRPGGARDVEKEVAALEQEIMRLGAEADTLQGVEATTQQIGEWRAVGQLVDRRAFSWTGLLAALERALPPGVRLAAVRPVTKDGDLTLSLSAVGRSVDDVIALPKALQAQGEFDWAFLDGYTEGADGVSASCTVRYLGGSQASAGGVK